MDRSDTIPIDKLEIPRELENSLSASQYQLVKEGAEIAEKIVRLCSGSKFLTKEKVFRQYQERVEHLRRIGGAELEKQLYFLRTNINYLKDEFEKGTGCDTAKEMMRHVLYGHTSFLL